MCVHEKKKQHFQMHRLPILCAKYTLTEPNKYLMVLQRKTDCSVFWILLLSNKAVFPRLNLFGDPAP